MERRGQFTINGHHSSEFNVSMRDRPERISAGRVVELRQIPGNDSIVIDNKYYQNVERKINCYAKAQTISDVQNLEDQITAWLDMGDYSDLHLYYDEAYIYQAIVISPPVFTGTRKNGNLIPFSFTISLRPFKESFVGRNWVTLTQNMKLHNNKKYPSKPLIKIQGSGDISFFINNKSYKLTGVVNEITIDSRIEESYKYVNKVLTPLDSQTKFNDFPVLQPGINEFRWTGNVSKIEILPRWVTKI